ncbi:hypothetical protein EV144_1011199 [Flavobacterium sp. 270]|uniref:hypothetical protein n=1 Tax=Flavobacterium sp. 270 TaxID=2512114 RepID=UPI001066A025|nr:hypothetical protein [Flavobacterium sp. 270]TDW52509.1 hypothetical protein EV144_1011199 [Flavobacterium sp. 270]
MNHFLKLCTSKVLFLFLFLFLNLNTEAQNKYAAYTDKITQFSKPCRILYHNVDKQGNGSIEFTNQKNQVLRCRFFNHKPQVLHGGIVYQLFYYEKNLLQRIDSYDISGKPAGERESENEAVTIFIIEKPDLYHKKKQIIDQAEGNIDMKDDSAEKIIRVQFLGSDNLPIKEEKPFYISSKTYWNYNDRMYWP